LVLCIGRSINCWVLQAANFHSPCKRYTEYANGGTDVSIPNSIETSQTRSRATPAPSGIGLTQALGAQRPTEMPSLLPELVDIQTVARALGISMRQVRRFVADGQMPFVRVGHLIRFDPNELKGWIDVRRAGSVRDQ
jgi:excisionase family DNA binding protein